MDLKVEHVEHLEGGWGGGGGGGAVGLLNSGEEQSFNISVYRDISVNSTIAMKYAEVLGKGEQPHIVNI